MDTYIFISKHIPHSEIKNFCIYQKRNIIITLEQFLSEKINIAMFKHCYQPILMSELKD